MLNSDIGHRCDIVELGMCPWMQGPLSALHPYSQIKHCPEVCLPQDTFPHSYYQTNAVYSGSQLDEESSSSSRHLSAPLSNTPVPGYTPSLSQPPASSRKQKRDSMKARKTNTNDPQQQATTSSTHQTSYVYSNNGQKKYASKPFKLKLGAAGRKFANAVFGSTGRRTNATKPDV